MAQECVSLIPGIKELLAGAGPHGLAIAAHLQFVGINFRIFGSPMRRWLSQMPKSMLLKSEGSASSLPDPAGRHILAQYCREEGLPYSEYGAPVSRDVLARYAISFQQKLVPHVEDVLVIAVSKLRDGLELCLSSGEKLQSANVLASANSFGSAMRFLVGTGYTARRIASHVAKNQRLPAARFARLQKCLEK